MMLSVITPVHGPSAAYLPMAFESLLEQTHTDWEWIVLVNNGGRVPANIAAHAQVMVHTMPDMDRQYNVGLLKRTACQRATGDIYVELDADDLLAPNALGEIAAAFQGPGVAMAYSNDAEFENETWEPRTYSEYWGWRTRDFEYKSHALKQMVAWEPGPHMMRYVYWAPDHVRAWRSESYWAVGGHDPDLLVADDHDLCCRFYLRYGAAGLRHIDGCLYLYRVHPANTVKTLNADIQAGTLRNYLRYSRDLAVRWASDEGLRLLDLGGRFNAWDGFETVDIMDADIEADLNGQWPFENDSVGVLKAHHVFEHLHDPVHVMNEAYRVLAPGGWLFVEVPSTDGRGAFQDPTHVSFWNENSFWYYTRGSHARFIRPHYTGRFQASRVVTYYPTDFERENNIPIVQADLIALKPPYSERPVGEVLI